VFKWAKVWALGWQVANVLAVMIATGQSSFTISHDGRRFEITLKYLGV
jgi:hypothetical protein